MDKDLSVRQVEEKIQKMTGGPRNAKTEEAPLELDESYFKLLDFLGKYFNNNISLKRDEKKGTGSITIRFSGDQEIMKFIDAIEKTNL
ncbi:hypothetical protein SDC9_87596 [bioreactor metagenome]|uniref:Chromosome partitioning protein ParB n=1 Tax=bioreactor metagenome TaxID=1076179 RepID=A0A644ZJN7_9ZZZZ